MITERIHEPQAAEVRSLSSIKSAYLRHLGNAIRALELAAEVAKLEANEEHGLYMALSDLKRLEAAA